MLDDLIYPGAEFLFEVIAMGGPMFPVRFYAIKEGNNDQVAQFYLDQLPMYEVEIDEIVDDERWLRLDYTGKILEKLNVEHPTELIEKGKELDGSVAIVEIAHSELDIGHSDLEYGMSFIDLANRGLLAQASELPADSLIIVLSYFKNPY